MQVPRWESQAPGRPLLPGGTMEAGSWVEVNKKGRNDQGLSEERSLIGLAHTAGVWGRGVGETTERECT